VEDSVVACLHLLDRCAAVLVLPVAAWILLNGLDDLIPLFVWLKSRIRGRECALSHLPPVPVSEKRIAIFVPLWQEHRVIGRMVERNINVIRYPAYDFFIGAYPNDPPTVDTVRALTEHYPNVHLALCPHDGPTSKADCLNWIYQRMLLFEEQSESRFDLVVTHDAEDLIHPDSLHAINRYADHFDMVQVPVIPLPTPFRAITHGLYCDDFAESQTKDMVARQALGSFIPSCGVGTAFSRRALETIAHAEANRIFEPNCLTEDYENGFRLRLHSCPQAFVPLQRSGDSWMATREYFPRSVSAAIRQRTRWITGIALQTWERHGWRHPPRHVYWLWRDRKSLLGSPASLFANLLSLYGVLSWALSRSLGIPWGLPSQIHESHVRLLLNWTLVLQCIHLSVRIFCSARLYGLPFALGAPVRAVWGNWINARASFCAVRRYVHARIYSEPLAWVKTEHSYPSRAALVETHRLLGEILVGSDYISAEQLQFGLASKGGLRIGEFLVAQGILDGEDLCEALSLQQNLPCGRIEPDSITRNVARSLPAEFVATWKAAPFRIFCCDIFLASPNLPSMELQTELRKFTRLEPRFHLVTEQNFAELRERLLRTGIPAKGPKPSTAYRSASASG
jgi:adsorption protein B